MASPRCAAVRWQAAGRQRAAEANDPCVNYVRVCVLQRSRRSRGFAFLLTIPGLIGIATVGSDTSTRQAEPESSYVVLLAEDPVVAYEGDEPGLEATAIEAGEKLDVQAPEVEEYVDFLEDEQADVAAVAGVEADDVGDNYTYVLNGFEVELTESEVAVIERLPEVAKVVPNELRQLETESSGEFLGLDDRRGAWQSGYVGEDVVVGVIDSGIWPEHASFADDGSYAPLDGTAICRASSATLRTTR